MRNGSNLDRVGKRELEICGTITLAEAKAMCREAAGNHPLECRRSNAEHQPRDVIERAREGASTRRAG